MARCAEGCPVVATAPNPLASARAAVVRRPLDLRPLVTATVHDTEAARPDATAIGLAQHHRSGSRRPPTTGTRCRACTTPGPASHRRRRPASSPRSCAPAPGRTAPAGLGLAVVRGISELHEGTATAYSAGPGTGAPFTVVGT